MSTRPAVPKAFLAFARTKPAEEEYEYVSNSNCAFAQFLKSLGYAFPSVGGITYYVNMMDFSEFPKDLPKVLREPLKARTWGELVQKLEAAL